MSLMSNSSWNNLLGSSEVASFAHNFFRERQQEYQWNSSKSSKKKEKNRLAFKIAFAMKNEGAPSPPIPLKKEYYLRKHLPRQE